MDKKKESLGLNTRLQHPPKVNLQKGNEPLVAPIYQSVKYSFESYESLVANQMTGFFYSRISNPTVRQLEKQLAELQGRDDAICVSTGVASISLPLIALLKKDDHVILFTESYMPTRYLIRDLLAKYGVTHTLLSVREAYHLEKHIQKGKTRLVIFETPTNPSLSVFNLKALTATARAQGVLTLLDNTLAGFHQHGQYDVDIYIHSLTKYASGHGDVMGGAIITSEKLLQLIKPIVWNVGATLDPHAAYLLLRGMKTYHLRYERQCENAFKVASFLEKHSMIKKVSYPGLASHPHHALVREQMKEFGTIVTAELQSAEKLPSFINRLKQFVLAGSLGSTESLIAPAKRFFGVDLNEEQLKQAQLFDGTFRLSIGIEDSEDLIRDLDQALS
ncbi:MAG: PLP-dependent aspartate aminotransferase family protein [Bdellovibrionales bacterium]